jgi:hypothetical protein
MKTVIAIAMAAATVAAVAPAANARPHHRPHKVCTIRHHHRVCRWVR